ncbi:MAG: metallophosphoesterase family protein [Rhodothermales bacterium]
MTLGIFSDIHANLPALEAVLADFDRRRPDMLFCLGDLVGYAPWPNEVVEAVRARGIPTIAGNYDEGVGLHSSDCGCAYKTAEDKARGAESIAFTNEIVTGETRAYLRGLPRHLRIEFGTGDSRCSVLMVHGSPRRINEYLFEDRPDRSFLRMMAHAGADVMLFGHTHKPYHKVLADEAEGTTRYRHAINTGSVGKPKDGDPRACYVLMHTADDPVPTAPDTIRVEVVRVAYDVERAAQAVEAAPLPDAFADMLRRAY